MTAPDHEGVEALSRLVAGNDHLTTEPGLVLALQQGNATPADASAIDQFVGGLKAEVAVRNATATGAQIHLSPDQQSQLDAMGVNYNGVLAKTVDPVTDLRTKMAQHGLQPKVDATGKVVTTATGDVVTEPLQKPADGTLQAVLNAVHETSNIGSSTGAAGKAVAVGLDAISPEGLKRTTGHNYEDTSVPLSYAYNVANSYLSEARQINDPSGLGYARVQKANEQNDALARRLSYDPSSTLSMLAFRAKGYTFNDASQVAGTWDEAHPKGLFGLNGDQAVTEAEAYLDDPQSYTQKLNGDTSLTPEQIIARNNFANSPEFQDLVKQVVGVRQSVGTDMARSLGIDPVKHSTLFKNVASANDFVASFVLDPLAVGASAYTTYQRTSVALRGLDDSEGITRILRAASPTRRQEQAQRSLRQVVDLGNQMRDAIARGDQAAQAAIQAKASQNDLGGLLADFVGHDQMVATRVVGRDGSVTYRHMPGSGTPIDTYDKAVDYIASKNALLRLKSGRAPIESSVMPGALSSWAYSRVKGAMMASVAGRSAGKTDKAIETVLSRAEADPALAKRLIDDKQLTRVLPTHDDAVDFLSGDVIAAKEAVAAAKTPAEQAIAQSGLASAQRALAERQAELEAKAPLAITDKGVGVIRRNTLDFGQPLAPKGVADIVDAKNAGEAVSLAQRAKLGLYGQLGTVERAKVIATRVSNWLPRDLTVNVNDASAAEDIRRAARGFMSSGDSQVMAALWAHGTLDTRKAILQGLRSQVYHAAGLSRTAAGRQLLAQLEQRAEKYSLLDHGATFLDRSGNEVGLYPGQMQIDFTLPNFGQIQKASAKIGLYEATMGRMLASKPVELTMALWRTLVLGVPVTATRAITEAYLNAAARGRGFAADALAAKWVMKRLGRLSGHGLRRSRIAELIAGMVEHSVTFGDVHDLLDRLALKRLGPERVNALANMPEYSFEGRLIRQSYDHYLNEVDPGRTLLAKEITSAGLHVQPVRYNAKKAFSPEMRRVDGYKLVDENDAEYGADAFAMTLATRVNSAPDVTRAILDRLENKGSIDDIVKAYESGDARRLMHDSNFGRLFMRDGHQFEASTPEEIAQGKRDWAQMVVDDMAQVLHGRNGVYQQKLADYLREHGVAPKPEWLKTEIKGLNRPKHMIAPNYVGIIPGLDEKAGLLVNMEKAANALIEGSGKVYQWAVERLIQRHATGPLFALAYADAKVALERYKTTLMEEGLSEPAAEQITAQMAEHRGWDSISLMVDDPAHKSQMDVVGRSFFAFSRATTTMLRRWGTTLYRNPAAARRMQLAAEGAVHSGLVYKDENGDWMMAIPGSGAAQEAIYSAMSIIPGLHDLAKFPVADFTGRVASIIPGSDNPFQYATTPFVSITGRAVASLFPNQREIFDEIDAKLNGTAGQGQGAMDTLLPRLFKMAKDGDIPGIGPNIGGEGRDSVLTSAMVGALYNMKAAGLLPAEAKMGSAVDQQALLDTLKTQTRSVLFTRFLLGTLSPMSISTPTDSIDQRPADPAYAARGVQSLKDEYKTILNDVGGDFGRANVIWAGMHPHAVVYEESASTSLAKSAVLPATDKAYKWLAVNDGFVNKYGSLAAYFVPEDTGKFSMAAYRAQLEQGFRQRKTPGEFLQGVYITSGQQEYYANEDTKNADLAKATAQRDMAQAAARRSGQPIEAAGQKYQDRIDQINQRWKSWSDDFKAKHPIFAEHLTSFATNASDADRQYRGLQQMVQHNEVPGDAATKAAVADMVSQWEQYKAFTRKYPGTTSADEAAKSWAKANLQSILNEIVTKNPSLRDLYDGVFRPLNSSLTYLGQGGP